MKSTSLYHRLLAGLVFLPISILLNIETAQGANPAELKKILYINSYHVGNAWSDSITKGILSILQGKDVELFTEYIDAKHFGQTKFLLFAYYLEHKYKNTKFDGVIVSDNDAMDFAIRFGNSLFPFIPIVFCGINEPENFQLENSRFYGFIETAEPQKTLILISKLFPKAKRILVLADNTTTGLVIKNSFKILSSAFPKLQFNIVEEIDVDSLFQLVKSGLKGDVVSLNTIFQDKYGNRVDYPVLQQQLAAISPKPVFCSWQILGKGIIGEYINKGFDQGTEAALMELNFLNNPHLIVSHINKIKEIAQFDYRALKKFEVSEALLPSKFVILNKPEVNYWRYIIFLILIAGGLFIVILIFIFNLKKRTEAERKVKTQILEIHTQNAQLENSYKQLGEMNCELEETNIKLFGTNESLIEAMKKAEESDRLKSSFLANMSHEIRTPLNAIVGFSSLLIDPEYDKEKRESFVNIINSSCDSLLILIGDILDLSKIEAGQLALHMEDVNVLDLFSGLLQFMQLRNQKNLDIRIAPFSKLNPIILFTDKIRVNQILTNLLTNSLKFTDTGFIEVGYKFDNPKEIVFYVKDSGIGIEQKNMDAIFDRFIKIETSPEKIYAGTGLGLAISKKLVELLGGKIWLESKWGFGSAFYFTHPL